MTLTIIRFESPVINLIGGLAPLYEGREEGEVGQLKNLNFNQLMADCVNTQDCNWTPSHSRDFYSPNK